MSQHKCADAFSLALVECGMPENHDEHGKVADEALKALSEEATPAQICAAADEAMRRHLQRSWQMKIAGDPGAQAAKK